ncbi:MAG: hypothetical protein ACLT9P_10720 [Evtepia gabavorous]
MMEAIRYDVVVVGGGPGGLAAAQGARLAGAASVSGAGAGEPAGGILNQCVHDGFGLVRYREALTGPEYAQRAREEARSAGADLMTGAMVTGLTRGPNPHGSYPTGASDLPGGGGGAGHRLPGAYPGAIAIPGTRPAGVYTAGTAQNLMNTKNLLVGRRVVVLGSGDIGLIMARRMTLEGAKVLCVAEQRPAPGGAGAQRAPVPGRLWHPAASPVHGDGDRWPGPAGRGGAVPGGRTGPPVPGHGTAGGL